MPGTLGVFVTSEQIFDNSLPLANLADSCFLDFTLTRVAKAFPDKKKFFAMAFTDFQKVGEDLVKHIESFGFTMFMGDLNPARRLVNACAIHGVDVVLDIPMAHPLASLHFAKDMLASHAKSGADLTMCHNMPTTMAPVVVNAAALSRFSSLSTPGFRSMFGMPEIELNPDYVCFMLNNPEMFKLNLFEAPMRWRGAGLNLFRGLTTELKLDSAERLPLLRDLIFTINKSDPTSDDVIDYVLIRNMQEHWGRPGDFDTKKIVADQAKGGTLEGYRQFTQEEVDWFVLSDKKFLKGRDITKSNLLEVGCGHARLLDILCGHFREVHGIDITRERYMEGRFRLRDKTNAHVVHGDGRSLRQFGDDTFDFVICHGVLVHINSKEIINNYILEMGRVAKKGGRVKFDIYEGKDIFGITPLGFGLGARYEYDELRKVIAAAGLKELDITEVFTRQYFRNPDDGKDYSNLPLKQLLVVCEKK